jgi:hypothetical protein
MQEKDPDSTSENDTRRYRSARLTDFNQKISRSGVDRNRNFMRPIDHKQYKG